MDVGDSRTPSGVSIWEMKYLEEKIGSSSRVCIQNRRTRKRKARLEFNYPFSQQIPEEACPALAMTYKDGRQIQFLLSLSLEICSPLGSH